MSNRLEDVSEVQTHQLASGMVIETSHSIGGSLSHTDDGCMVLGAVPDMRQLGLHVGIALNTQLAVHHMDDSRELPLGWS